MLKRIARPVHDRQPISRTLIGGVGLLAFLGAFFVLPLGAALALCSMPCCEHRGANGAVSLAPADVTACETECAVRTEDAAPAPPAAVEKSTGREPLPAVPEAVPAEPALIPFSPSRHSAGFLHGADAPLHVLNSVFRI